jgi:molybdopterin-synthase adenylyltransferase
MTDPVTPAVLDPADRFARSRLIEGWDQDRLAAATAVVAGVGALGNEVAKNLALAGVGRLILCDPDTVGVTNLSRSVLFTDADVGRPKVDAAAAALHRLAPDTDFDIRPADLAAGVGLGELADAAVVLGCLDSLQARMRLLGRCSLVDAPLVDGGTRAWGGEVRVRLGADGPCYACALSPHERGADDLPWSCADPLDGGPAPAAIVSTAIVASWMTLAALRTVLGAPPSYRLLAIDGLTGRAGPVQLTRDPACPHHRPFPGPIDPIRISAHDTVGALLTALPEDCEPFSWNDFPVPAHCPRCGDYHQVGARGLTEIPVQDGAVSACGRCGTLLRQRASQRLRDADAGRRLEELGVAPQEILSVRLPKGGYRWHRLRR